MAQAFDARRLKLEGDAEPIAESVMVGGAAGTGAYTVSDSEFSRTEARPTAGGSQLVWLSREGKLLGSVGAPDNYYGVRLSPDNGRLAVSRNESGGPFDYVGAGDLWMFDLIRGTNSRFTFNGEHNTLPVWAPDGSRLAFACGDYKHHDVCSKLASGAGEEQVLLESDTRKLPTDWSSDGRYVIYHDDAPNTPASVWALPTFGDRKPVALRRTQAHESQGRLSPDGRWLAYTSDQDGKTAVYVQGFPTASGPWQVSSGGGEEPRWRGDARELFYVATDGSVMAVPITTGPAFRAGVPAPLFHTRMSRFMMGNLFIDYEVAADGLRFLVNQPAANGPPITVVQNWVEGLKR